MWLWFRRRFVTGLLVTVPLVVSVVAMVWVFRFVDRLTSGLDQRVFGTAVPGVGILTTVVIVLIVGVIATNVFGRQVLERAEELLLRIPVFKTVYAPLKQVLEAFAPDNASGFKRVAIIDDGHETLLGFVTKEFDLDRGQGPEPMLAVFVPTNQLYLGRVIMCRPDQASYPNLSVEQAIRIFLTGGMGLPPEIRTTKTGPSA